MARTQDLISNRVDWVLAGEDTLSDAMRYALTGGKMLRGFLVLESARLHGVDEQVALDAALAIECLHAYSLVHDDLPCMDNDDLRRGMPTLHRQWDEGLAVLAGDALQSLAFELLADAKFGPHALDLIRALAQAAGKEGMVSGQMLDIAAESSPEPLTLAQIIQLQSRKTGCLISWSAMAGAVIAGADTTPLRHYADALGLAFQIADDILDVEGDAETVGKRVRKDAAAGKATFVSLLGLEAAKARAVELCDQACAALDVYGDQGDTLREAARFVISRDS
ncbi:polyprenyl synthetase family protein [Parasedimentitalea psychrophila]|uniref:Geranylgeranyl diphosphate synthase n=1 Tax=Parasedimentitalea psychrophila TaxID=2997337 RepID=A0A9Y2P3E3_9RHOB|nr:farnesyl diphosphate synthase [Parasedimentitalea psychrophila]WIY27571.1 polyprenyl synthetase family protein [Parasedimentitalea psychrophila]